MKIIFYILETANEYARDQHSERRAKKLADALMNSEELPYKKELKNLDYYSQEFRDKIILKRFEDDTAFHAIIPGGQNAQESLECLLTDDIKLPNIFIIYNSVWDLFSNHNKQFGQIDNALHYNLFNNLSSDDKKKQLDPSWKMGIDIVNTYKNFLKLSLFALNIAKVRLFNPSYEPLQVNKPNMLETQSINEPDYIWERAINNLPEKIDSAIQNYQVPEKENANPHSFRF